MIQVIYGGKGTGKTKQMIDSANQSAKEAKGIVVYIDKNSALMHDLDNSIRLVDAISYGINGQRCLLAFIKGMLACNFDIEKIYIDGSAKISQADLADMQVLYQGLVEIYQAHNIDFVISASGDKEQLPSFVTELL